MYFFKAMVVVWQKWKKTLILFFKFLLVHYARKSSKHVELWEFISKSITVLPWNIHQQFVWTAKEAFSWLLFADQVLLAPVHVQSHKQKQIQFCGNEICLSFMMRPNLKNPAMECCQRLLQVQQKRWSSMKNI